MKKLIYAALTTALIFAIGSAGFFSPKLVSNLQDKNEEGLSEKLELEEVVLNYGTEPGFVEKLKLFRDNAVIYNFVPDECGLTQADAEQKAISYLTSVLAVTGDERLSCSAEPFGMLFENGDTLSAWYVSISYGFDFAGEFIIDDPSGMILGFHVADFSEVKNMEQDLLEEPYKNKRLDDEVFAEKLIESYGILNCEYKNGYIYIPVSEEDVFKLRLSGDGVTIDFNNGI